jgi:hypothetical protein
VSTYPEFRWKEISVHAYSVLVAAMGGYEAMKVFGAITDMGGQWGEPEVMTEWGPKEADYPIFKITRNPEVENSDRCFVAFWREVHA